MNLKDAGIYDIFNIFRGDSTKARGTSSGGIISDCARTINIPAYQRPYRWTEDNIIKLFEDYDEERKEYFIGSAVAVEKHKEDGTMEYDVVDGQQRLTTLYLINFVRYLLKREYILDKLSKSFNFRSSEYCKELKDCYVGLIGKNANPFDNIINKINELSDNDSLDVNDQAAKLYEYYRKELCIPELMATKQESDNERWHQASTFFDGEQLCLKYSRKRYDDILLKSLCSVYLEKSRDTFDIELKILEPSQTNNQNDSKEVFFNNYIQALNTIFEEIWERAKRDIDDIKNATVYQIMERAIALADCIIRDMSLCIVLTENENDANKLFEVLNDRALGVDDLELIKNHYYKEYCTKSNESEEQKDKNINLLDELWSDVIFNTTNNRKVKQNRNELISYLAAVYLTCDDDLVYKDNAKLKNAIDKKYSSVTYRKGFRDYNFNDIKKDFNIYYAIKIILDEFDLSVNKSNEASLGAEQEEKSITFKALHLMNALGYHGVMPALTNVIISTYSQSNSLCDDSFDDSFRKYIKKVIDDKDNDEPLFENIHRCAFTLWMASIKCKDYISARNLAKRIIVEYGNERYKRGLISLSHDEWCKLNDEYDKWISDWTYSSKKTFKIKIILLNLMQSSRRILDSSDKGYLSNKVEIQLKAAIKYTLDAGKLQLDHLEANKINQACTASYYLSDDIEKRNKDVNGYVGNFMILDAVDNNEKKNVPLYKALSFYTKIEKTWLVEDIADMICDNEYFDQSLNIPKETFFIERTKRLKKYFYAFLDRQFNQNTFTVDF